MKTLYKRTHSPFKKDLFFSLEQKSDFDIQAEQLDTLIKESLNIISDIVEIDQVRNFLQSSSCDESSFDTLLDKKSWSPAWNEKLAQSLGKEALDIPSVKKIQKALGTFPDGKFGPHSLARLLKLKKTLSTQSQNFSHRYIDDWDQKSKNTIQVFDAQLEKPDFEFLQQLFQDESTFYGAQIKNVRDIKVLGNAYMVLAEKDDKWYRILVNKDILPPQVSWEEVLETSFYDKTFGAPVQKQYRSSPEKTSSHTYTVKKGDALIRILRNSFGKTEDDMRSLSVEYRDPRANNQGTSVFKTDLIYPGQKIWIEGDKVIISKKDERKEVSPHSNPSLGEIYEINNRTTASTQNETKTKAEDKDPEIISEKEDSKNLTPSLKKPSQKTNEERDPQSASSKEDDLEKLDLEELDLEGLENNNSEETPPKDPEDKTKKEQPENTEILVQDWSPYSQYMKEYYYENALSKKPSFLKKVGRGIRSIFTSTPPKERPFSKARKREKEKFNTFADALILNFEFQKINPPQTEEELHKILDKIFEEIRKDPELYKEGELFFSPEFVHPESLQQFKLDHTTPQSHTNNTYKASEIKNAHLRYKRTQKILRIVENSIKNKIWEKDVVQN